MAQLRRQLAARDKRIVTGFVTVVPLQSPSSSGHRETGHPLDQDLTGAEKALSGANKDRTIPVRNRQPLFCRQDVVCGNEILR
jgi:hypothetical protein